MLDTKDFDSKISTITTQLAAAQDNLDKDPFTDGLKQYGIKGDLVNSLKLDLIKAQSDKETAVALQADIDVKTKQLSDLQVSVSEVAIAQPIIP